MAFLLLPTAEMTAPVEVSSCESLHASLVPVTDSKPSLVPEFASRPMQVISRSSPPTSFQLVILPVKISAICRTERSATLLSAFTMTAMPSSAMVVPVRPSRCP